MSITKSRGLKTTKSTFLSTRIATSAQDKDTTATWLATISLIAVLVPNGIQCDTIPTSSNRFDRLLVPSQVPEDTPELMSTSSRKLKKTFSFHKASHIRIAPIPICTIILLRDARILWSTKPHRTSNIPRCTTTEVLWNTPTSRSSPVTPTIGDVIATKGLGGVYPSRFCTEGLLRSRTFTS